MEEHLKLSDTEFEQQFSNCTLNPAVFSHEAHLRLAWIHIQKYGLEPAEQKIQIQLLNFVEFVGAKDKYHTTITVAAIKAVGHFIAQSKAEHFKGFIAEFPELKNDFKTLINRHYSFDVFNSTEARAIFIQPDLVPF